MAHENLAEEVLQFQSLNIQLLENNQVTPSKAALAQFPYIYLYNIVFHDIITEKLLLKFPPNTFSEHMCVYVAL